MPSDLLAKRKGVVPLARRDTSAKDVPLSDKQNRLQPWKTQKPKHATTKTMEKYQAASPDRKGAQ